MGREEVLARVADHIASLPAAHPQRVAVDGIDAAGKTMLADELAPLIEARGRPVIRASIDGFHRPRAERYALGPESPMGYYRDSFDYPALWQALLVPLGPHGSRRYRTAVFDLQSDHPLTQPEWEAAPHAVLVLDGVFLLRPELNDLWEYRIFVHIPFEEALKRARRRDLAQFGSADAVEARYRQRYIPGQRLYLSTVRPRARADVVLDNTDPMRPRLVIGHAEEE